MPEARPLPAAPAAWLPHPPECTPAVLRGRWIAVALLAGFAAVAWFGVPHGIGSSWRECDTQAIARNFLLDGFEPLRPRVDWRGDSDGAVECEFPLYQMAIAALLFVLGDVDAEWPGRALSLLAVLAAAFALHRLLEWRTGPVAALAGLAAFLCSGSALLLATRVMPDAASLAFTIVGVLLFCRWLENGFRGWLAAATFAVAIGALQKPLALQVGIALFGWAALLAPRRLGDPWSWLAFTTMPAIVAAWLVHGAHLHAETGLTFGVVSGGDTKFPDLAHAFSPGVHWQLLCTTTIYGLGVLGIVACAALAVQRRLDRGDVPLLLATAAGLFVSLRYSHSLELGPHYHAFAAVLGAWLVARAFPERAPKSVWALLLLGVAVQGGLRLRDERGVREVVNTLPIVEAARLSRQHVAPGELVIVRSEKSRADREWQRDQNCEDPRFFYLARVRGWVVAHEELTVDELTQLRAAGAKCLFDPRPHDVPPAVEQWLADHADLVVDHPGGRFHRLRPQQ